MSPQSQALENLPGASESVAVPPPSVPDLEGRVQSSPVREWTVMFYFVGKCDLEGSYFTAINDLEGVGSGKDVNLIAEWGRMRGQKGDSTVDGDWTGARFYYITPDDNTRKITSTVLAEMPRVDMGDWKHLAGFVKWNKTYFPAKRYMLFIAGHGSGWYYARSGRAIAPSADKGIAFDDETGNFIDTPQLAQVFKTAGPVDILVNDSCLLQGLEAAYELKAAARVVIGAEDIAYDQDYPGIAARVMREPLATVKDLAAWMVKHYGRYYGAGIDSYDLSALDASAAADFVRILDRWTDAVTAYGNTAALARAKKEVKRFYHTNYADLQDFIEIYNSALDRNEPAAAKVLAEGDKAIAFLNGSLLVETFRRGPALAKVHGLSVQMPGPRDPVQAYRAYYNKLAISKASNWAKFMELVDSAR